MTNLKVFCGGRGSGKTTKLIEEAAKGFFYIVCADKKRADYILRLARDYDLNIPHPLTFREFLDQRFIGRGIRGFLIDDADDLLRSLCDGVDLVGFSYLSKDSWDSEVRDSGVE